ncbi:MAG: hypothetical protein KAX37_01955 [Opitutaceae bacterium]|nr:hypothetical protein [Opitutaceae bacterium]
MTTNNSLSVGTATASDIPPEWIEVVRATLDREGVAFRAGVNRPTIEVQSVTDGQFRALMLPRGGTHFSTPEDRDAILRQLSTHPKP